MLKFFSRLFIIFLVSFFFWTPTFASTIARPIFNSGLVGYWNFEEGKGNSVAGDRSGFGNDGQLTNMNTSTNWTDSATSSGKALDFDASDDYVDAGSGAQLDNLGPMTISAWYFARGEGENARGGILNKGDGNGALVDGPELEFGSTGFDGVDRTNAFAFGVGFSSTPLHRIASNNTVTLNKWQFLTLTWDGSNSSSNVHIYIDGVEVTYQKSQDAVGTKLDDSSANMLIGIGSFGAQSNTWDGRIDEVRVYRRVLSYDEIQRLYKIQKPRVTGGITNNGLCGSGISAEEKYKNLKDGTVAKYIYYGCTRARDINCKGGYLEEKQLVTQLLELMDRVDLDKSGIRKKLEVEIERHKKFHSNIMGKKEEEYRAKDVDIRNYAKYVLNEGSIFEKRDLIGCLRSKVQIANKRISL
jgi:hypothetical protein